MSERELPGCVAVGLFLVLLGLSGVVGGCGGALGMARTTTIVAGEAVLIAQGSFDAGREVAVHRLEERARAAHPDDASARVAAFEASLRGLQTAADALDVAARTWRMLASLVRAWESGEDVAGTWQGTAACVAAAFAEAVAACTASGISLPEQVTTAASDLARFAGGLCRTSTTREVAHGE